MDGSEVRTAAGTFLGEALGWPGAPEEIGASLDLASERQGEAVYAAEIETEAGNVALLVFAFMLGESGDALRAEAARTMLEAAELGTPGPRLVAEGEAGEFGLLLATTPAGLAILTGEAPGEPEPGAAVHPVYSGGMRASAADALLDVLREAERRAADLLRVLPGPGEYERTVEERALALFLLDPSSLASLTRAMRRMVDDSARDAQPK